MKNPRVRTDDQTEVGRRMWGQKTKGRYPRERKEGTEKFSPSGEKPAPMLESTKHGRTRAELVGVGSGVPLRLYTSTMDEDWAFSVE